MKLLYIVTVITVLAAPSTFGNKLHFNNIEVSTGALTDISNIGMDEERTPRGACCCRLSWRAVSYQPSGSTGPWRLPPPTIVQLQRIVYSSNQLIKKPHTHAHFCVCLTPPWRRTLRTKSSHSPTAKLPIIFAVLPWPASALALVRPIALTRVIFAHMLVIAALVSSSV